MMDTKILKFALSTITTFRCALGSIANNFDTPDWHP